MRWIILIVITEINLIRLIYTINGFIQTPDVRKVYCYDHQVKQNFDQLEKPEFPCTPNQWWSSG